MQGGDLLGGCVGGNEPPDIPFRRGGWNNAVDKPSPERDILHHHLEIHIQSRELRVRDWCNG